MIVLRLVVLLLLIKVKVMMEKKDRMIEKKEINDE